MEPTEKFIKMADFVLKNSFLKFSREVKRKKLVISIGSKFAPPYGEEKLVQCLKRLNNFHPNLSFLYETLKNIVNFLDLNVSIMMVQYMQTFILHQQMVNTTTIISHPIQVTLKCQYHTVRY